MLVFVALLVVGSLQAPSASAITTTVEAEADGFVSTWRPDDDFGEVNLRVRGDNRVSYIRFVVPEPPAGGSIAAATLRLYSKNGSQCALGVEVLRAANDSWDEQNLSWDNQPGTTGSVLALATWTTEGYQSFDVSPAVTASGPVSFVVRHADGCEDSDAALFRHREAWRDPPLLIVETGPTTSPSPSPSPSVSPTSSPTSSPSVSPTSSPPGGSPPPPGGGAIEVAAAGDVACAPSSSNFDGSDPNSCQQAATADLLQGMDAVLVPGDLQYPDGALADFQQGYDLSWGQHAGVTYPVPGNHEYHIPNAQGYFDYWASKSRPTGTDGYYSFDLGSWHFVALNTSDACSVGPACSEGSAQNNFLEQDLAATTAECIIAYWHHPLFNSGSVHSGIASVEPLWDDLYAAGADIVVNAHEHNYQRFAKQDPNGVAAADGIREFIAGTGGSRLYALASTPERNLEAAIDDAFGVLKLSLGEGSYTWQFVDIDGQVLDSGGPVACNN